MSLISKFKKSAWKDCRMVLPEGEDPRVLEAALKAKKLRLADPFFVGNKKAIEKTAKKKKLSLKGIEIIDISQEVPEKYIKKYTKIRKASKKLAEHMLSNPLFLATLLVKMGEADAMVAGAVSSSADVISASTGILGLRKGVSVPSSFFIMELPEKKFGEKGLLLFADSSVNIELSPQEMADVAVTTARTAKELMGWAPRVAMLSFSTKGSAVHPRVDKVAEAAGLAKKKAPRGAHIDGEFQGDSALVPSTAKKKIKGRVGPVAGKANVLIFPDLDSGNISYKLTQCLGRANAYGPILQGFRKPVSDLSRGAKPEDILGTMAILSTWAKRVKK